MCQVVKPLTLIQCPLAYTLAWHWPRSADLVDDVPGGHYDARADQEAGAGVLNDAAACEGANQNGAVRDLREAVRVEALRMGNGPGREHTPGHLHDERREDRADDHPPRTHVGSS
jgi:hypothetical protein